jgi:hypothetical protein
VFVLLLVLFFFGSTHVCLFAESFLVFATLDVSTGSLGGLTGADSMCASEAAAAGLNTSEWVYRALLSTSIVGASERVLSGIAFANANRSMLAPDHSGLFSGSLSAPVLTLSGFVPSIGPHTGTKSDGGWSSGSCADWTEDGQFYFETVGLEGSTSGTWLQSSLCACCQQERPILCVQGT